MPTDPLDADSFLTKRSLARKPSPIRALMPLLSIPGMISLGGGMPNEGLFPVSVRVPSLGVVASVLVLVAVFRGFRRVCGLTADSLRRPLTHPIRTRRAAETLRVLMCVLRTIQ